MSIRAIVFDVGGVLKITPRLGIEEKWEKELHLKAGEMNERLSPVWEAGSIGLITIEEVHTQIGDALGLDTATVDLLMVDVWTEYLGTLNVELTDYFRNLRPRFKTEILSNSLVSAREKEQDTYHFHKMTDIIVYSHEAGISKPDQRIFELICERLNIQPVEMVFLDDVEPNIEAARALGIHAILFQTTAQAIADIQACIAASD